MRKVNQKGQSLFEVLFATALAAMIVTGVASVAVKSLRNAQFAQKQSEARQTAQNLLEAARDNRDSNPGCVDAGTCDFSETAVCSEFGNYDVCQVNFTYPSSGIAEAEAVVSWTDGSGSHTVTAYTKLTAWQN